MNQSELIENWKQEQAQPFIGWDFSYLNGRLIEDQAPWSYSARAADLMKQSSAMIDLGTGGGERLLTLREYWPDKVVVTEDYAPNFKLATERLSPLGVTVLNVPLKDDDLMPFANGEFDLVLNRHSGFNPEEVARILTSGGTFLTQQIHGLWADDLLAVFDAQPQWPDATPEKYLPRMQSARLHLVDLQEWSGRLAFTDVGAIVYYLKAIPWLVPGFSVESHGEYLLKLQERFDAGEKLSFRARKYLIEVRKV
ncbi:MAG TPA: methyltransferase domain-containing protein [Anaerolineales bacterium]|nr:methyltransferase domain-containing protein [Anaerolineales bacterium]